jgi:hypothetical protein
MYTRKSKDPKTVPCGTPDAAGFVDGKFPSTAGEDPGFQVRGAHLKKLLRAEGGAKNVGVFRVKNQVLFRTP